MTVQLHGVLTALATPFAGDGTVDEARLRAVVNRSIEGGVHGVATSGAWWSRPSSSRRRAGCR